MLRPDAPGRELVLDAKLVDVDVDAAADTVDEDPSSCLRAS